MDAPSLISNTVWKVVANIRDGKEMREIIVENSRVLVLSILSTNMPAGTVSSTFMTVS